MEADAFGALKGRGSKVNSVVSNRIHSTETLTSCLLQLCAVIKTSLTEEYFN